MPPKKKATSKIIDGVDTSSMTREQLEEFAQRIKEENDREREERNFFQIERDKIKTFWEITKAELEEAQAQLRNKDRQIEEAEEKNEEEIKLFKQKLKHLQYEHENNLTEAKAETLVALKQAKDEYAKQERELLQDKRDLTKLMKEQELSNQEKIKALRLQHAEEISKARTEFETRVQEIDKRNETKFDELRSHLTLKYEMEISQLEERKNEHISELIRNNEKAFNEIKNYYNDIVLNNLALISSLKDQMEVLRKQHERMNKQVGDLTVENKRLDVPLNKALEEVKEYKKKLQRYERDKLALINNKSQLIDKTKKLEDLQWTYDALELRFENLQKERDELHNRFVSAVLEVQQKAGIKNLLLSKRIETLSEVAEHKEAVIAELQNVTVQPPVRTNRKLEEILSKKNATISDLQYELARVCKAHDDLLSDIEHKLVEHGINKVELGFEPLRIKPENPGGEDLEGLSHKSSELIPETI